MASRWVCREAEGKTDENPQRSRTLHVLIVTHYFPTHAGGIEIIAGEIASRLAQRGVQVSWAATEEPGHLPASVLRLPMRGSNFSERRLGVPYPIWSPGSIANLVSAIRQCDLVHIHDYHYLGSIVATIAGRLSHRPVVITQHVAKVAYRSPLLRTLQLLASRVIGRMILGRADRCVYYGNHVRSYFTRFVRHRRSPLTIMTGVDHSRFRPTSFPERQLIRDELGLAPEIPAALFVGRFVEKKGLRWIRELAARFPECIWLLAGWGPEDPTRWRLPNVRCLGQQSQEQLVRWYQAADLLVLPSFGEGLPLVVQEAMACGLPALIFRETAQAMPGLDSVALVTDPSTLSEQFSQAIHARAQLRDLGQNAAEFARQHWCWEKCTDEYIELFEYLLQCSRRGGRNGAVSPKCNSMRVKSLSHGV